MVCAPVPWRAPRRDQRPRARIGRSAEVLEGQVSASTAGRHLLTHRQTRAGCRRSPVPNVPGSATFRHAVARCLSPRPLDVEQQARAQGDELLRPGVAVAWGDVLGALGASRRAVGAPPAPAGGYPAKRSRVSRFAPGRALLHRAREDALHEVALQGEEHGQRHEHDGERPGGQQVPLRSVRRSRSVGDAVRPRSSGLGASNDTDIRIELMLNGESLGTIEPGTGMEVASVWRMPALPCWRDQRRDPGRWPGSQATE
jgi:hypothetical protein